MPTPKPKKKPVRPSHTVRVKITLLDDARDVVDSWVVSIADPPSEYNALVQARTKARNDERYAPGDTVEAALVQRWTARKAVQNPSRKASRPSHVAKPQTRDFDIGPGDSVTILTPHGQERTGRAVMRSSYGGWVLNMGGAHGTPGLADTSNIVRVRKARKRGPELNPGRKKIRALDREQSDASWRVAVRALNIADERGLRPHQMKETNTERWDAAYAQVGRGLFGSREGLLRAGEKSLDRTEGRALKSFAKRKAELQKDIDARRKKARGGLRGKQRLALLTASGARQWAKR